ncbi:MAG: BrnT family toxin [Alphaproteobacteria bacterium]|nr:MAG: BrnT family toxin [Alphaproteobacteria bacterium]
MEYEWDKGKNARNKVKHGIDFDSAVDFDWRGAHLTDRSRHTDGEARFAATGYLGGKLFTLIFTIRGKNIRIISLRRANTTEEKAYVES